MKRQLVEGSWINRLMLWYAVKILKKGNQKIFELDDLYDMKEDQKYTQNYQNFQKHLKRAPRSRSLLLKILEFQKVKLIIGMILDFLNKMVLLAIPYVLKELINQLDPSNGQAPSIFLIFFLFLYSHFRN